MTLTDATPAGAVPAASGLPAKDRPILLTAIAAGASYLLAGDVTHFGHLYGTAVEGVHVLPPARYLAERSGWHDPAGGPVVPD